MPKCHLNPRLMTQDATLDALQGLQGEYFMSDDAWTTDAGSEIEFRDYEGEPETMTGFAYGDDPLFPRRRDVRDTCEEVLHALLIHINNDSEFDREFLTGVRDLMREGVPFDDAVGSFAPDIYEDEAEAAWKAYHDVVGLGF